MREILFRGKRTDNGEWVYGYHVKMNVIAGVNHLIYPVNNDRLVYKKPYIVEPETVGQYTGLNDKNGKKIFEGDIIEFEDCGGYGDNVFDFINMAEVVFYNGRFEFGKRDFDGDTSSADAYCNDHEEMIEFFRYSEVVGNIHDNPELLEVPE